MDTKIKVNFDEELLIRANAEDNMKKNSIYNLSKRFIDIIVSVMGILVLSPIFILTAIFIKIESRGPILFKQIRAGKDSKPFCIYKFRSMRTDAPNLGTNEFTDADIFITKVGKIIRKTSIDELPQLFNILKGDMSIVGPRPVILEEKDLISLRKKRNIDTILPGITGLAQINGRDNIGNEEKVKYDEEYLNTKTLKLDVYIILMTAMKVVKRSDIK